jgi:hypothetical protein
MSDVKVTGSAGRRGYSPFFLTNITRAALAARAALGPLSITETLTRRTPPREPAVPVERAVMPIQQPRFPGMGPATAALAAPEPRPRRRRAPRPRSSALRREPVAWVAMGAQRRAVAQVAQVAQVAAGRRRRAQRTVSAMLLRPPSQSVAGAATVRAPPSAAQAAARRSLRWRRPAIRPPPRRGRLAAAAAPAAIPTAAPAHRAR